jgi:hypothetical protein
MGFRVGDVLTGADPGEPDPVVLSDSISGFQSAAEAAGDVVQTGRGLDGLLSGMSGAAIDAATGTVRSRMVPAATTVQDTATTAGTAIKNFQDTASDLRATSRALRKKTRAALGDMTDCRGELQTIHGQISRIGRTVTVAATSVPTTWTDTVPTHPARVSGVPLSSAQQRTLDELESEWASQARVWDAAQDDVYRWRRTWREAQQERDDAERRFCRALTGESGGPGLSIAATGRAYSRLFGCSTPVQVAACWSSLTPAERQQLINDYPDKIGNLDGVPYTDRDQANQIALRQNIIKAKARIADLNKQLTDLEHLPYQGGEGPILAERDKLTHELDSLNAIQQSLNRRNSFLISLDVSHPSDVLAAVSIGNLDTASNAVWLVPGMNAHTTGIDNYTDDAKRIHDDTGAAVVAWMGYHTPNEATVSGMGAANAGGKLLANALEGYDAVRPAGGTLTVLAHSYGSTTAWQALSQPGADLRVNNLVTVGSAGFGAGSGLPDNAATQAQGLTAAPQEQTSVASVEARTGMQVFSTQANGDTVAPIGVALGLRADPRSLPGVETFGSNGATIDGQHYQPTDHHGIAGDVSTTRGDKGTESYLTRGTESYQHIKNILTMGKP